MSDTEEKDEKPVVEDLRRSKRKKFHLDVVAVLSNRRSPDFCRLSNKTDIDSKSPFKSKNSNNTRRVYKKLPDVLAPILEPMFPIIEDDKSLLKIASSTEPTDSDNSNKRQSNGVEENVLEVVPLKRPKSEQIGENLDNQLLIKTETKPLLKAIVCYKCQATFKSNAGLGKHVKTCKKYADSSRLSLPERYPELSSVLSSKRLPSNSSSNSLVSLVKKESDGESLEDSNEMDDAMPILTPECSLQTRKARALPDSKPIVQSLQDKRKRISAQGSLQASFDIKKALSLKLDIPAVPKIIVDSPIDNTSDYIYCSECPFKTADSNLFAFHEALHENHNRTYQCALCSFSCLSADGLHFHLNLHAPALSPNTASTVRKHIIANKRNGITHNDFTPTTSTIAQRLEQVQTQKQRLVSIIKRSVAGNEHAHKRIKTRLPLPSTKVYSCKKCSFVCERRENLVFHEELHGRRLLYACKDCNYSSNSKKVRDYHERHHHFVEASLTTHTINLTATILKKKGSELNGRCNSAPPQTESTSEENNQKTEEPNEEKEKNDSRSYQQNVEGSS